MPDEPHSGSKPAKQRGLVAVFDILGYQQFLRANDIDYQIEVATKVLDTIPEQAIKKAQELHVKLIGVDFHPGRQLNWRVFSDLILFSIPLDDLPQSATIYEHTHANDQAFPSVLLMLAASAILLRTMFEAGFPLRGAIDMGDYFASDKWLAGRPIVEAYQTGSVQNWSGCMVSRRVEGLLDRLKDNDDRENVINALSQNYSVPTKSGLVEGTVCSWTAEGGTEIFVDNIGNPREYVMDSFTRHGKTVGPSVLDKVSNTEAFIWHHRGVVEKMTGHRHQRT